MGQHHYCKRFTQIALLVLCMSTVCVSPILAAELEVDELIENIRSNILVAEKREREQPLFGVKEVKLTISYAVEKKGEGGFKAFVITAGASISSHAVQNMEIILTPLRDMKVEKQRPEEKVSKPVYAAVALNILFELRIPRQSWFLANLCGDVGRGHPPNS